MLYLGGKVFLFLQKLSETLGMNTKWLRDISEGYLQILAPENCRSVSGCGAYQNCDTAIPRKPLIFQQR